MSVLGFPFLVAEYVDGEAHLPRLQAAANWEDMQHLVRDGRAQLIKVFVEQDGAIVVVLCLRSSWTPNQGTEDA